MFGVENGEVLCAACAAAAGAPAATVAAGCCTGRRQSLMLPLFATCWMLETVPDGGRGDAVILAGAVL